MADKTPKRNPPSKARPKASPETEPTPATPDAATAEVETDAAAAEAALDQAQDAADALQAEASADVLNLPDFTAAAGGGGDSASLSLLRDVNLHVKVELGRTRMYVEDVLRLNENSVVELDKLAGDPVDIFVNDRRVARGEVLVVNDNFCVRVNEIIQPPAED